MLRRMESKRNKSLTIKIKSPKSEIKLHRLNLNETSKISPELTIRSSNIQSPKDATDVITQAWHRLKITTLSKGIAIGADVGACSFSPASPKQQSDCSLSIAGNDVSRLDLRSAVTSTPVKLKGQSVTPTQNCCSTYTKTYPLDISEIKPSEEDSISSFRKEISELEALKAQCLNIIEMKEMRICQKKKDDRLRVFTEHDEKMREMLAAFKIELDRERLLQEQQHQIEAQKLINEKKANALLKEQQLQQNQHDHEKRLAETNEKIKMVEQKRKELEEKQKQKIEELKHCINGIYEMQLAYNQKYNYITEVTKKCRDVRKLNEKVAGELPKLKAMNEHLLKLVDRSKDGKVSLKDLKTSELLVKQITEISAIFSKYSDGINKSLERAEEIQKKEQLEKEARAKQVEAERQQKAKEETAKIEKENAKKTQQAAKLLDGVEDCISGKSLKLHIELSRYLEDYERKVQPLLNDDALKKFRFECQKLVNVPVNAISPLDNLHLEDKRYKLSRLLGGQPVPNGNTLFLVTGHHLGVPFSTNLLAKKFVKQGEHTVSSKPEAAFAIAAVIVSLWADFPDFGRLLLAHFYRECPYLIPAFLPQIEGQSNEDYYKMLGYQYSEDGKVEAQDKFLRRMSGVMRLYAAIIVTPLKQSQVAEGKRHPHSVQEAWRWLTAMLNLRPRTDISATLIYDFLEVAGGIMYRTYGLQFTKLLHVLCADYFPLIEQVTPDGCGGPVVRLKGFLEKILKEGQVPPPPGLLSADFW